jgi:hypothetical protein
MPMLFSPRVDRFPNFTPNHASVAGHGVELARENIATEIHFQGGFVFHPGVEA